MSRKEKIRKMEGVYKMIQRKRVFLKKHITGLDGLRGIATVAVVLYHMFPQQVKGGFLGVSLFFVLSGYLMAVTSERMAKDEGFYILSFYKKRILRIYPALVAVIGLSVIVLGAFIKIPLNDICGEILSIVGGYNNWWQINQNSSYFTRVNGTSGLIHVWSLAVEMQFYIIWPVLFLIYRIISIKFSKTKGIHFFLILSFLSLALAILLYRPGEDATRIYYGTDTRIYALLFGSALGFKCMESKKRMKKKTGKQSEVIFVACMVVTFVLFMIADGKSVLTYWIFLPVVCFLFLILVSISANPALPFGKLLDAMPLSWFGKYSYEIYLCQYPVTFTFKILNKGKYTFWQVILELFIVIMVSWILRNSFGIQQRRKEQKRWPQIVSISVLSLVSIGVIFSSGKLVGNADQNEFKDDLQASADLMNMKKENTNEDNISNGFKCEENNENLQESESGRNMLFIGDSVMLGAGIELQNTIPDCIVEAAESRQVWDATEIVNKLKEEGGLGECVVVGLGSNGSFDERSGQEFIDSIGADRKIYWISVYGQYMTWQESVNDMIYRLADVNANVTVIDWASFARGHSEWFYNDGMHLNGDGQVAYANFLNEHISSVPSGQKLES